MKIVGYMEGTNSEVLTNLLLDGYETLPLSNGWDNHGKYIAHINRNDDIALVVGYLHKFIPVAKEFSFADLLSSLKVYKIPVVFIVPEAKQAKATKLVAAKGIKHYFADPAEVTKVVMGVLKPSREMPKKATKK
jgi:hypothetical protein